MNELHYQSQSNYNLDLLHHVCIPHLIFSNYRRWKRINKRNNNIYILLQRPFFFFTIFFYKKPKNCWDFCNFHPFLSKLIFQKLWRINNDFSSYCQVCSKYSFCCWHPRPYPRRQPYFCLIDWHDYEFLRLRVCFVFHFTLICGFIFHFSEGVERGRR